MGHVEAGLLGVIISFQTATRFPFQPTADLKNSFAKKHSLEFPKGKTLLSCPLEKVSTPNSRTEEQIWFCLHSGYDSSKLLGTGFGFVFVSCSLWTLLRCFKSRKTFYRNHGVNGPGRGLYGWTGRGEAWTLGPGARCPWDATWPTSTP